MALRIIALILILVSLCAQARAAVLLSDVNQAFTAKNFAEIVSIYDQNRKAHEYHKSTKIMVMTAFALEKQKRFQDAANIQMRIIKLDYLQEHKTILRAVKDGESLDADSYEKRLMITYWNVYKNYGHHILTFNKRTPSLDATLKHFSFVKNILEQLEFREGQVDRLNDKILAHLKYLDDKIFHFTKRVFFEYLTWQSDVDLTINGVKNPLVITNKGYCAGGELGFENNFYHFFADACVLMANGTIQSQNTVPVYLQSNIPIRGIKTSIGAGKIVSYTRSEIGFKLPVMLAPQDLTDPPANDPACEFGCKVDQPPAFSVMASLYSRWSFNKWYFQTEFGKFIDQDSIMWSLGTGYKF